MVNKCNVDHYWCLSRACFQISEGCLSGLQSTLEEYIYSWKPSPDKLSYNHVVDKLNGCSAPFPLSIDEYLEVAEAYSVVLLGNVYGNTDHAASWIEAAHIPDARRQVRFIFNVKSKNLRFY